MTNDADIENKILFFLELGYGIENILKELNVEKESLADIIIELEDNDFITLEKKKWILTEKGRNILKERRKEVLKKLKIDYLYGNINKEDFEKRKKELESIKKNETKDIKENENKSETKEKIICQKCGKENKLGSKYCYKCGEPLKS